MPDRLSPAARDAALRRSTRLRGALVLGAVALAGGLTVAAARAQPGTVRRVSAPALPALTPPPSVHHRHHAHATPTVAPPPAPPVATAAPPQTASRGS